MLLLSVGIHLFQCLDLHTLDCFLDNFDVVFCIGLLLALVDPLVELADVYPAFSQLSEVLGYLVAHLLLELKQVLSSGFGFQVARVFLSVLQSLLLHYLVELLDLFLLVGLPHFLLDQQVLIRLSFRSDLLEQSVVVNDFLNGPGILNMNAAQI